MNAQVPIPSEAFSPGSYSDPPAIVQQATTRLDSVGQLMAETSYQQYKGKQLANDFSFADDMNFRAQRKVEEAVPDPDEERIAARLREAKSVTSPDEQRQRMEKIAQYSAEKRQKQAAAAAAKLERLYKSDPEAAAKVAAKAEQEASRMAAQLAKQDEELLKKEQQKTQSSQDLIAEKKKKLFGYE
jgi:hypothetical protein